MVTVVPHLYALALENNSVILKQRPVLLIQMWLLTLYLLCFSSAAAIST